MVRGTLKWIWEKKKKLTAGVGLTLSATVLFSMLSAYKYFIDNPGENIKNIAMARETVIYYDCEPEEEECKVLGKLFDKTHTSAVEYKDIPPMLVNALVAAEDKNYFKRGHAIAPEGLARAMINNTKASWTASDILSIPPKIDLKLVQGGSGLSQQAVGNLLDHYERSIEGKISEAIDAERLEHEYTKEEILEFYLNSFFVEGNGFGISTAAKRFFNVNDITKLKFAKEDSLETKVEKLNRTVFIAGSMKGPNNYNPFIGTEEERKKHLEAAEERKRYVLDRMLEEGYITPVLHKAAYDTLISFEEGHFRSDWNNLHDFVIGELDTPFFKELFELKGIENIRTQGLRIYTSFDPEIQEHTHYTMRKNLSRLDILLRGYQKPEGIKLEDYDELKLHEFYHGKILSVDRNKVTVDFGGMQGIIDAKGFNNVSYKKLKKEDAVYVSVREMNDGVLLDLEQNPGEEGLQGAAIILEKGLIRSIVGGFDNRGYNRAVTAKRQPGSAFKPIVYYAALQLGWDIRDILSNKRTVFTYHDSAYSPKNYSSVYPEEVSVMWGLARSQNIATVNLLYQLCDKLSDKDFIAVADLVGLYQNDDLSYNEFRNRVRDKGGIVMNEFRRRRIAFRLAKKKVLAGVDKKTYPEMHAALDDLVYGYPKSLVKNHPKIDFSNYTFEKVLKKSETLANKFTEISNRLATMEMSIDNPLSGEIDSLMGDFYIKKTEESTQIAFGKSPEGYRPMFFSDIVEMGQDNFSLENILLEGRIPNSVFLEFNEHFITARKEMKKKRDYAFDLVAEDPDFRAYVGMKYVIELAKKMGIKSQINPYLSMALGSQVVTLKDIATAYQTFNDGRIRTLNGEVDQEPVNQSTSIVMITDFEGNIIYKYNPSEEQIVDQKLSGPMLTMLRNAVRFGTGKKANKIVIGYNNGASDTTRRKFEYMVPIPGKTGTTNDYTNSWFAGAVPFIPEDTEGNITTLDPSNSRVAVAYIGFDMPKSMESADQDIRISGSSGGLPIFVDIAKYLVEREKLTEKLDLGSIIINGSKNELLFSLPKRRNLRIYKNSGILLPETMGDSVIRIDDFQRGELADYSGTILVPVYLAESGFDPWR